MRALRVLLARTHNTVSSRLNCEMCRKKVWVDLLLQKGRRVSHTRYERVYDLPLRGRMKLFVILLNHINYYNHKS